MIAKNTTIALLTLGCKLNYAETSTYERGFKAAGLKVVPWREGADLYLINTCSVTAHSDNKCRNIIRKCHRINPDAPIVVTGCYAELKRNEVSAIEGVKLVFGAMEKNLVVPQTLNLLKGLQVILDQGYKERSMAEEYREISSTIMPAWSSGERTRSFLKVQDGCDNFCAYCTVPFARGASRSISIAEALDGARQIATQGVKEIVLTGVNTGDFGRKRGENFLDLLKSLNEVEGIERYRISSIEPNLITDEIIDWITSGTKFQPHFHIPLQTGNDKLLKDMGRRYDTNLFASRVDRIREKMGDKVFFGIDVIAGLPGETQEMFDSTYEFLANRIKPAFIHVFPYSRRPGTRADSMDDQVREGIKTERVKILESLCDKLHKDFVASCKGMKEKVLWESDCKDGRMEGYTGNYIRLERLWDSTKAGIIEDVVI